MEIFPLVKINRLSCSAIKTVSITATDRNKSHYQLIMHKVEWVCVQNLLERKCNKVTLLAKSNMAVFTVCAALSNETGNVLVCTHAYAPPP